MDRILEFTSNNMLLVLALMISFFVLIFSELRRKASGMIAVAPGEAVALINDDATIVDLRSNESFSKGHIVNARNIPFDELDVKKDSLNKNKPLIAICDAGINSHKAVATLRQSGFESAYSLKGGMTAWGQAGLPVVTGKKTRSKGKKS